MKKVLKQLSEESQDGHLLTQVSAAANDLKQFLTYVLTALQQVGAHLGQTALEVVENTRDG